MQGDLVRYALSCYPFSMSIHTRVLHMADVQSFDVLLRPEPEGGFTVRVPAFPEIVTFGEDETEALVMAREAIELVLESRRERGEPIPASDAMRLRSVKVPTLA